jgi:hypothetical protein
MKHGRHRKAHQETAVAARLQALIGVVIAKAQELIAELQNTK